jgi:hypothetical protein
MIGVRCAAIRTLPQSQSSCRESEERPGMLSNAPEMKQSGERERSIWLLMFLLPSFTPVPPPSLHVRNTPAVSVD